jgi:hypothetical protein
MPLTLLATVANIMRPPVRPVDVQPPYHLFLVKTVPCIAAIVSRLNEPPADHAVAMVVAAIAAIIVGDKVTVIGATDATIATQIGSS